MGEPTKQSKRVLNLFFFFRCWEFYTLIHPTNKILDDFQIQIRSQDMQTMYKCLTKNFSNFGLISLSQSFSQWISNVLT